MVHDYNVQSSGNKAVTAGAQLLTVNAGVRYHGGFLLSNGTNAATMTVYHGIAATAGNEIASFSIPATTVPPQQLILNFPIQCPDGVFYVITGTGAVGNLHYSVGA